jgi:hypothetical protein
MHTNAQSHTANKPVRARQRGPALRPASCGTLTTNGGGGGGHRMGEDRRPPCPPTKGFPQRFVRHLAPPKKPCKVCVCGGGANLATFTTPNRRTCSRLAAMPYSFSHTRSTMLSCHDVSVFSMSMRYLWAATHTRTHSHTHTPTPTPTHANPTSETTRSDTTTDGSASATTA